MLLRHLLQTLPDAQIFGSTDVEIRDIAHDSRLVEPGALFVAVPSVGGGAGSGGIRFAGEAARRGAAAVVAQLELDLPGVTAVRVPDARASLADLAAAFFGHPSHHLSLYGVTGTDGKTTTSYLLEQILSFAGHGTGMIGTVEVKIGQRREDNPDRMTTPEAPDLQRLLRRMVDAGVTHAVMEVSSHALALQRVRACRFAACALTNITADHVEFHGSWEAYFAAKASLFTQLNRGNPAVVNRDDRHFERLVGMIPEPCLTFGLGPDANIRAADIAPWEDGSCFMICAENERAEVRLPLPGRFNVLNALAATGLALVAGVSLQTVAAALSRAAPPPGRQERVSVGQQFAVVVDYAHTPHAFRSVLATLRERTERPHRVIAVFGATGDRDRAKRPELARIAREYADFFIITNEDPFGEQPGAIMDEIAAGVPGGERGERFECVEDRREAIRRAIARARPGDTVVVLGKGHERSIVANGSREPWSDVAAIRQALEGSP